jgi:hypothetical protein
MTDDLTLDRLQNIINDAGIDDHEIIGGAEFSHAGYQKIATKMGVSFKDIHSMINLLIEKLRKENSVQEDYEKLLDDDSDDRFSYEKDFLGNVTIRDSHTGDDVFLRGQQSAKLLHELIVSDDEQEVLAQYMADPINEDEDEEGDADSTYEPEIDAGGGSYNFPWTLEGAHGTATAVYSGTGTIKIVSVRDEDGVEVEITIDLSKALMPQAVAFIGKA